MVTHVDGQVPMVKYKDGEKKILVPPNIPIVAFVAGDKDELKPSVAILLPPQSRSRMGPGKHRAWPLAVE
jgi:hypothetical protein